MTTEQRKAHDFLQESELYIFESDPIAAAIIAVAWRAVIGDVSIQEEAKVLKSLGNPIYATSLNVAPSVFRLLGI